MWERPVVDYGQGQLVKTALDDTSCFLLLPELSPTYLSRVHTSSIVWKVRWPTASLQ